MGGAVQPKAVLVESRVSHDPEMSHARHIGIVCLLRRKLAVLLIFMGAKIALDQLCAFIFFKNECGWVYLSPRGCKGRQNM